MAHRISFKPAAQRQLRKLPLQVQARLLDRIEKLSEEPYPPGAKKLKAEIDLFRKLGTFRTTGLSQAAYADIVQFSIGAFGPHHIMSCQDVYNILIIIWSEVGYAECPHFLISS